MTEKQRLERRLWDIANTLRGKMGADDFRDYTSGKEKLKSVYDPTCGSGSLLLRVAKEVTEVSQLERQPPLYE